MNYEYPFENDWKMDEIIQVIAFYNCVEKAYEGGISSDELLRSYSIFQKIVNSKSIEKQLDKQFQEVSGYSIYCTVKKAKESAFVKMI